MKMDGCVHRVWILGCKMNGLREKVLPSGAKWSAFYVNGMRHGLCQMWHPNGQKWREFHYHSDHIHGEYREWHPNGQLSFLTWYRNGVPSARRVSKNDSGAVEQF